jgi:hypothetical protein
MTSGRGEEEGYTTSQGEGKKRNILSHKERETRDDSALRCEGKK